MNNTLKTILVTISIIAWTVIVAIGGMTYGIIREQNYYEPQIEALQEEAKYYKGFIICLNEALDEAPLLDVIITGLEEEYDNRVPVDSDYSIKYCR